MRIFMEPWDTSREKAWELRLDQWGTLEAVKAMAAPVRRANNRREAVECLKEIAPNTFTSKSGLPARISGRGFGKLVSSSAVTSSFCPEAHYFAVANIDRLYSNAIEPWEFELNPNKENARLKARRYLYAPMEYGGKITIVKFTVKEYEESTQLENKLYSIEAVGVELKT